MGKDWQHTNENLETRNIMDSKGRKKINTLKSTKMVIFVANWNDFLRQIELENKLGTRLKDCDRASLARVVESTNFMPWGFFSKKKIEEVKIKMSEGEEERIEVSALQKEEAETIKAKANEFFKGMFKFWFFLVIKWLAWRKMIAT